jgi:phage terminase Nu1 subunit (DNA packaging protein)
MFRKAINYASVVFAVTAVLLWLATNFYDQQRALRQAERGRIVSEELEVRTQDVTKQLQVEMEKLGSLQSAVDNASKLPATVKQSPELSKVQVQLAALQNDVRGLKKEVDGLRISSDKLNGLLLSDVNKALSVPLLRDDLESFRTLTQHDLDSVRADIAKTYDINKWLMGLIAAGLLTTIVNNILQSRRGRETTRPPFE